MTTKSNQSISKRVLMFCGSALVTSTAVLSFSSAASAGMRDIGAGPIWNKADAQAKCPNVCRNVRGEWRGQWRTVVYRKNSVCGCFKWTFDKSQIRHVIPFNQLTAAERNTYYRFLDGIRDGFPPKEAARRAGDTDFKQFRRTGLYQIRLSRNNRITFTINDTDKVVTIRDVGGHTE